MCSCTAVSVTKIQAIRDFQLKKIQLEMNYITKDKHEHLETKTSPDLSIPTEYLTLSIRTLKLSNPLRWLSTPLAHGRDQEQCHDN